MTTERRALPVASGPSYDVIVLGGGPSGTMAGIAAARAGARTLVADQHGFFGGSLTAMGVGPMMSFHNNVGQQVIEGLPQELIDRLIARGASPGHVPDSTTYVTTVTPFDSEYLKIELEEMVREAGADVLFHTQLAAVALEADGGRISEVVLCNKGGLTAYRARVFVDASGDGDLATRAGAPFVRRCAWREVGRDCRASGAA
jgi:flavin-dependent dehydrogenase